MSHEHTLPSDMGYGLPEPAQEWDDTKDCYENGGYCFENPQNVGHCMNCGEPLPNKTLDVLILRDGSIMADFRHEERRDELIREMAARGAHTWAIDNPREACIEHGGNVYRAGFRF